MSGLSREDRARLEVLGQYVDCEVALRALALIDQREKALEAADELAQAVREQIEDEPERLSTASTVAFEVYQATRDRTTKGGRNDG